MRWLPALLLLAACRLGPEAEPPEPTASEPAASESMLEVVPATAVVPEAEPPLDTLARNAWGGAMSVDSFRALVAAVDTSTASGIRLLSGAGRFHGGEVEARTGERWQGLYPTPRGPEVRSFEIVVETAYDPIVDDEDGPYTGQRVVTPFSEPIDESGNDFGDPSIALVRRAGAPFPNGPLPTAFDGGWAAFEGVSEAQSRRLGLTLGETAYGLDVVVGPEVAPGVRAERVLILSDGMTTQAIAHLVDRDGGRLVLEWAGDLDGDGRLDLLLDVSDHYNAGNATLYLSSEAASGALVGHVAEHWTTGC